jgi:hypothetical protein
MTRAVLIAALAAALTPATAHAAASEATYEVTFKAQMSETWNWKESYADDCKLTGVMCTRDEVGSGSATVQVKSRRPTKMLVMRGPKGRPPVIGVGTGEGVPLTGSVLRNGSLTTTYGGPWAAANPNRKAEDKGCGRHTIKSDVNFVWEGANRLAPLTTSLDLGDTDCPDGPSRPWEWANDESPSLMEAFTTAAPKKFLGTKQFTVRGQRTWTGVIAPFSNGAMTSGGDTKVTWTWEATFRKVGSKRR